jgi:hypothetical protein
MNGHGTRGGFASRRDSVHRMSISLVRFIIVRSFPPIARTDYSFLFYSLTFLATSFIVLDLQVGVGRDDSKSAGEFNPIFYRRCVILANLHVPLSQQHTPPSRTVLHARNPQLAPFFFHASHNSAAFTLLETDTFWLSWEPFKPGSHFPGAGTSRLATSALFQLIQKNSHFF